MKNELIRNWMTTNVISVSPDTYLNDARKIMAAEKIRALPVIKQGQLVGIITRRGLLRADVSPLGTNSLNKENAHLRDMKVGEIMTPEVIVVTPTDRAPKAARVMLEYKITALPVLDEQRKIAGIVTSSDMFRLVIDELPATKKHILVKDYMTSNLVTIEPDTAILEAHRLMGVMRIRALPVMKDDELKGIVTRSDLMAVDPPRAFNDGQQEASLMIVTQSVEKIMTTHVLTIHENSSIVDAAKAMYTNKIHSLPVLDSENKVVGIITESDIFKMIIQTFF